VLFLLATLFFAEDLGVDLGVDFFDELLPAELDAVR
jgi:hypothetical protein